MAPRNPISASFCTSSRSKRSLRSLSRARGTISRSANSLAVSRTRRCSSVSSKSITGRHSAPWRPRQTARPVSSPVEYDARRGEHLQLVSGRGVVAAAALAACAVLPAAGAAQSPSTEVPVFSREVPRGTWATSPAAPAPRLPARAVDCQISDWVGQSTRLAGTTVASRGELIYQDHLFDAYGPDDGRDKRRLAALDPAAKALPETYRLDAAMQADIPGEFGFDTPAELKADSHYGDMPRQDAADLEELRLASDRQRLWVMARTTTLTGAGQTALLMLLDTAPGSASRQVPWNSKLRTDRAETALLLAGDRGWVASLATGKVSELPAGSVATNPDRYTNAIEAAIPRSLAGGGPLHGGAAPAPFDAPPGPPARRGPRAHVGDGGVP